MDSQISQNYRLRDNVTTGSCCVPGNQKGVLTVGSRNVSVVRKQQSWTKTEKWRCRAGETSAQAAANSSRRAMTLLSRTPLRLRRTPDPCMSLRCTKQLGVVLWWRSTCPHQLMPQALAHSLM